MTIFKYASCLGVRRVFCYRRLLTCGLLYHPLGSHMVNFKSPIQEVHDFSAHTITLVSQTCGEDLTKVTKPSLRRDTQNLMGHHIWRLPVRVLCDIYFAFSSPLLVGNMSQHLTTSWMSFGGVGPTGGRYGSWCSLACLLRLTLNCLFGRSTRFRASPPYSPSFST